MSGGSSKTNADADKKKEQLCAVYNDRYTTGGTGEGNTSTYSWRQYRVLEIDRKERNRSSRGRKPKNERENEMDVERRRRGARE